MTERPRSCCRCGQATDGNMWLCPCCQIEIAEQEQRRMRRDRGLTTDKGGLSEVK